MSKKGLGWLFVISELLGLGAWHAAGLILVTLIWFGIGVMSARLNPRVPHRGCAGRGFHRGTIFAHASHRCTGKACGGTGTVMRPLARIFGTPEVRAEARARRSRSR